MDKKIFPPEIIQFTAEHHFTQYHSRSKIIYLIFVIFIFAIIIASPFIPIDLSTQSRGIIRTPNENNKIQAAIYGEVSGINFHENKMVEKGDILLTMRTDKIDEQIAASVAKKEDNELNMSDINLLMADKVPVSYRYLSEYNEFVTKRKELTTQILYNEKELKRAETLFRNNITPEQEYLQAKNKYESALKQKELSQNEYRIRWQTEKKRMELENIDLASNIQQLYKEKRNYTIVAPVKGSVIQCEGVQPGSFITPGQIIGYLSQDKHLIAECYIKPSDIGYIRIGQEVSFQFDAFNYREWGMAKGKVIEISNDIVTINQSESVFKVRCSLQKNELTLKSGYQGKIKKGMTITGQFYLTRRALAQLLFDKVDNWMNPKLAKIQ